MILGVVSGRVMPKGNVWSTFRHLNEIQDLTYQICEIIGGLRGAKLHKTNKSSVSSRLSLEEVFIRVSCDSFCKTAVI